MTRALIIIGIILTVVLIYCNSNSKHGEPIDYTIHGNILASRTFDTLSQSLQKAIREKGFEGAIGFCSEKAYPLTAAYKEEEVNIKRVAMRVRNADNQPTDAERIQLELFEALLQQGDTLPTKLVAENTGVVHYYKPIMIQPLCLNCHGTPGTEIAEATLKAIQANYPYDEAIGYKAGDFRGLWHITFSPKNRR